MVTWSLKDLNLKLTTLTCPGKFWFDIIQFLNHKRLRVLKSFSAWRCLIYKSNGLIPKFVFISYFNWTQKSQTCQIDIKLLVVQWNKKVFVFCCKTCYLATLHSADSWLDFDVLNQLMYCQLPDSHTQSNCWKSTTSYTRQNLQFEFINAFLNYYKLPKDMFLLIIYKFLLRFPIYMHWNAILHYVRWVHCNN